MQRLFLAIDLPDTLREMIHSICFGLQGARWIKPEQIHLTLRFIGEVDDVTFRHIGDTLSEVRSEPFQLQVKGIGHFPPRRTPKVLWLGIPPNEQLSLLRKRIESQLIDAGLEPEGRKFSPHITLARFRDPPSSDKIAFFMAAHSLFETPPFKVEAFHLYSSFLTPKGALHQIENSYSLKT